MIDSKVGDESFTTGHRAVCNSAGDVVAFLKECVELVLHRLVYPEIKTEALKCVGDSRCRNCVRLQGDWMSEMNVFSDVSGVRITRIIEGPHENVDERLDELEVAAEAVEKVAPHLEVLLNRVAQVGKWEWRIMT